MKQTKTKVLWLERRNQEARAWAGEGAGSLLGTPQPSQADARVTSAGGQPCPFRLSDGFPVRLTGCRPQSGTEPENSS